MNKCIFIGNLAKDVELKTTNNGMQVGRFSLALQRMKKDDGADFINMVCFGKTAETIAQYLKKGSKAAFECHVQTGSYDNQEGKKVYTTDFIVDRFEFCGGGAATNNNSNTSANEGFGEPVYNDDIPF